MKNILLSVLFASLSPCLLYGWESRHCPDFRRNSLPLVEEDDAAIPKMIDVSKYPEFSDKTLYSADLNGDGQKDLIICAP